METKGFSSNEWKEWANSPLTQAFVEKLADSVADVKNHLAYADAWSANTALSTLSRGQGAIMAYNSVIELVEDLKGGNDDI